MQQFFVTADAAQFVSFAAKVVVGFTVPRTASLLSFFSTPKALIFYFFGDFGNLFALATDSRWWPSVRKHRTPRKSVEFGSWTTVLMALLVASAVLITDLLLFQLAPRKDGYRFKLTNQNFTFTDAKYHLGSNNFTYPEVLLSNVSARQVFGNKVYVANDAYTYMNYKTQQDFFYTVDGPRGEIKINNLHNNTGVPRCTVAHAVIPWNVQVAASPVRIRCFFDYGSTNQTDIIEETTNTLGFNGNTIVSYYQTKEGANYLFVELVKRAYDHLETFNGTSGDDILSTKVANLEADGYTIENVLNNGVVIDMANNTLSTIDLIRQSVQVAAKQDFVLGTSTFLFSKTELSFRYGRTPVYTKKFILWGTYLGVDFFEGRDQGNFYSYSYDTRQMLIPNGQLRGDLYGMNTTEFIYAPLSVQFSTDRTDDEVVLATLQDPELPLQVIPTEMIDIFPGLIVIGICGVYVLTASLCHLLIGRKANKKFSFEVSLEVYHKALDNINGLNAWYIPAKLEGTNNVAMQKGVSLISNQFTIGLASKGTSTGIAMMGTSPASSIKRPGLVQT